MNQTDDKMKGQYTNKALRHLAKSIITGIAGLFTYWMCMLSLQNNYLLLGFIIFLTLATLTFIMVVQLIFYVKYIMWGCEK